ncbi:NAD-dependent epimerase/dehydratase family protein [Alicyclobacillus macrosporangiidus]|uniref:UDP-glucose 4-epimerase n=1 Tax=Alicyclobacillus macrosporangiidus TaxID=392015 RepID=A0A1I7KW30_9BACL|nr:NAD-dependent epimerase/dehydratase family protein [Alicyclobacillus macrosporangiidus]SFV01693.1 UDP-glucose 4-epimerase [Alicyclobacillus macrosporangiidus]
MYEGANILVTGGAGFLGSRLVERLAVNAGHVWVVDDLSTGRAEALPSSRNVTFIKGSVSDGCLLRELLSDVDYVFHFAARNIVLSVQQPESDYLVNTHGTVQLLLNSLAHRGRIRRWVYASTASVYGNSPVMPIKEGTYDVSVPYAASKLAGELFAVAYGRSFGLPVTCLRFSNVYGPGQTSSNPYCGVVSKFMQAILDGEPLTIYGDGTQTRDFTFVDDAIQAALLAGVSERTTGRVLNVGTGIETPVNTLAQLVMNTTGNPRHPVVHREKRKVDGIYRRVMDATALRSLTGWQPIHTLDSGLKITWEWFLNQHRS